LFYVEGAAIMEALQGYTENGRIIPLGNPVMPDGLKVIITIIDEPTAVNRAADQKKAFKEFSNGLVSCAPLPPEFDEIVNERVNITRGLDL
jgi:PII-like signaling protein